MIENYTFEIPAIQLRNNSLGTDYNSYTYSMTNEISIDELYKCEVKHTFWEVTSEEEHAKVFDEFAKEWIRKQSN
jgi:hypothetical protein